MGVVAGLSTDFGTRGGRPSGEPVPARQEGLHRSFSVYSNARQYATLGPTSQEKRCARTPINRQTRNCLRRRLISRNRQPRFFPPNGAVGRVQATARSAAGKRAPWAAGLAPGGYRKAFCKKVLRTGEHFVKKNTNSAPRVVDTSKPSAVHWPPSRPSLGQFGHFRRPGAVEIRPPGSNRLCRLAGPWFRPPGNVGSSLWLPPRKTGRRWLWRAFGFLD